MYMDTYIVHAYTHIDNHKISILFYMRQHGTNQIQKQGNNMWFSHPKRTPIHGSPQVIKFYVISEKNM